MGSSTAGSLETATKRSLSISETRDRAAAVRLECRNGTMLKNMETTWGRVIAASASEAGRALKQERVPRLGSSDVSVWCAQKRLLTKLRVHHGLPVANIVEGHHEGVLHAACGR